MADKKKKEIRWGILGYGGAFNMGKNHASWINASPQMSTVAVCDTDKKRLRVAEEELPGVKTYEKLEDMLAAKNVDCVVIILPHNVHFDTAKACLEAGKGVCLEKPMCIHTDEATELIELAKKKKKLLTVFHNRRHDGDFMAVRDFLKKGIIGDVFRIEAFMGGYGHPGKWWRSQKEVSGGLFYDWGAHQVDWILNFMEGRKIKNITGFFHKKVWKDVSNEDETQALIRFDDGAVADLTISQIAKVGKPRWRILGTKGAIVDHWDGKFTAYTDVKGVPAQMTVNYQPTTWEEWYPNLAEHLVKGKKLEVTAEEARRVIMVLDYAERSAKAQKTVDVPFD